MYYSYRGIVHVYTYVYTRVWPYMCNQYVYYSYHTYVYTRVWPYMRTNMAIHDVCMAIQYVHVYRYVLVHVRVPVPGTRVLASTMVLSTYTFLLYKIKDRFFVFLAAQLLTSYWKIYFTFQPPRGALLGREIDVSIGQGF